MLFGAPTGCRIVWGHTNKGEAFVGMPFTKIDGMPSLLVFHQQETAGDHNLIIPTVVALGVLHQEKNRVTNIVVW